MHVVQWPIKLLDSHVLLGQEILTYFELKVYSTRIQQSQTRGSVTGQQACTCRQTVPQVPLCFLLQLPTR